jgi:hypothetical protein
VVTEFGIQQQLFCSTRKQFKGNTHIARSLTPYSSTNPQQTGGSTMDSSTTKEGQKRKQKRSKKPSRDASDVGSSQGEKVEEKSEPASKISVQADNIHIAANPSHPFEVDESDHCESPLEAYRDVLSLLDFIAKSLGKNRETLRIYDPYYCDGGVKAKLASLGFHQVINENEDFYENIEKDKIPSHDVLVTNPPYSGQHMEKMLSFASKNRKPFLLLLPHFVYTKDYYERGLGDDLAKKVFYVVPQRRYSYIPPSWVVNGSAALAKGKEQTAPFPSFWYCRIPPMSDAWLSKTFGPSGKYDTSRKLHYAKSTAHIPREFKGEFDETKKRPNPRARKRMATAKKRKV